MSNDKYLTSLDPLTIHLKESGIKSWHQLIIFIKGLPYGRNNNRNDLSLVITEKKGTCSSKHALLKKVADLNNIPKVKLMLWLYKMNRTNTPKIGTILEDNGINFIPEAHCYLMLENKRVDLTTEMSEFQKIENDIILEREIKPEQVSEFKVVLHQDFLKKWIRENNMSFSFEKLWRIREQCIHNLSCKLN